MSTDFITDLPESGGDTKILVVVGRHTKISHFIPIDKNDSPMVAKTHLAQVWGYHRFLEDVISDKDRTFTRQYFTDLYAHLWNERSMSTAFHLQTDGEMKGMNRVIDADLRAYCNSEQSDWAEMVPIAKFTYSKWKHRSREILPFYCNYEYEPGTNWLK